MAKSRQIVQEYNITELQRNRNAHAIPASVPKNIEPIKQKKQEKAQQYKIKKNTVETFEQPEDYITTKDIQDEAKSSYLKGNPFFHHLRESNYAIENIEEFYVKYKKNFLTIDELVRYSGYKVGLKRKIIKSNFMSWKKDYLKEKKQVFKGLDRSFTMLQEIDIKESKGIKRFIYIVLFVFLALIHFNQTNVFEWIFGASNTFLIQEAYVQIIMEFSFIPFVVATVFYGFFLWILVVHITDGVQRKYRKDQVYGKSIIEGSKSTLDKEFSKRFKKVLQYYFKKVCSNPKRNPPIKMDKVSPSSSLTQLEVIKDKLIDSGAQLKKYLWLIRSSRFILFYFSIIGVAAVVLLQVFVIVKGLFF